jgi:hypothetical protein
VPDLLQDAPRILRRRHRRQQVPGSPHLPPSPPPPALPSHPTSRPLALALSITSLAAPPWMRANPWSGSRDFLIHKQAGKQAGTVRYDMPKPVPRTVPARRTPRAAYTPHTRTSHPAPRVCIALPSAQARPPPPHAASSSFPGCPCGPLTRERGARGGCGVAGRALRAGTGRTVGPHPLERVRPAAAGPGHPAPAPLA